MDHLRPSLCYNRVIIFAPWQLKFTAKALVTNTLTNVVRTIFDHLRNGKKIVRTAFARVFVTKALIPLF